MEGSEAAQDALSTWLDGEGRAALEGLTSGALDVIGIIDRELRVRYLNWATLGLRRDDLIGNSALDLVPPDYRDYARARYLDVLRTGVGARFDIYFQGEEQLFAWDVRVGPIQVDGQVIGLVAITTDATEQRRADADRDRFFSLSLDLLVVLSPDGRLKRANPALGETLGYDAAALAGASFTDLLHPEDRARSEESFTRIRSGSVIDDFENRYRHADGTYRVFSWRATLDPVTGDVYAVARDITMQRATEAQLRHARKMEAIGQLAGGVAHDFNNLLQAILGNAELAALGAPEKSEVAERLDDIESAATRAADLTRQLLAFSRRQPLHVVPVDMNEVARTSIKLLRRLIPANIDIELIEGTCLATVIADPTQMEQLIVNLCVNARDAMEGGGRLTLETQNITLDSHYCDSHPWAKPGPYVRLSVTDTGVGMTPEVRDRIFEPFFTTKKAYHGTGLGLSTVYGIVQQHEGVLHVYSEVNEGTTFRIFLPARTDAPITGDDDTEAPPPTGQETILLAEDEVTVRRAVVEMLQSAGYHTLVAENGAEALRLLREYPGPVHLAILDVVMPELGGLDTWEQMKSMRRGLRVLFASGYADARYVKRLPPGTEVLQKPFRMQDFLRRIRQVLDN